MPGESDTPADAGASTTRDPGRQPVERPDVLVLGGNPGGCAAAVTAARAGLRVLLLEPTKTLGGHNANGVFAFDVGDPTALGPVAREVADLVRAHYQRHGGDQDPVLLRREDQVWESSVAAAAWAQLCASTPGLTVRTGAVPVGAEIGNPPDDGVRAAGSTSPPVADSRRWIHRVNWEAAVTPSGDPPASGSAAADRHQVEARLVVDATYEGDLLEWAGVEFRIGREARSRLEPHAGRIFTSDLRHGPGGIPPQSVLPGSTGEADQGIMAFASRLHCRWYDDPSPDAAHRISAPSASYDPRRFRWDPQGVDDDGHPVWFTGITLLVGGKVVLNRTVAGNELAGTARAYVIAHPRDRARYRRAIVDHALDFLYFIQTEGGCPLLGLAQDEFVDNGHIPYRVYAREGRRLHGRAVLTEHDLSPFLGGDGIRPGRQPDAIAIGDWPMESRACADHLEPGYPFPEGWFFDRFSRAPYQVPYGCMVPEEIDNLLVCGPIGATHLAAGATRVESTRINLGTAAGLAAALALDRHQRPADVPVPELQDTLVRSGSALTFFADLSPEHPNFADVQRAALRGWVPADEQWRFEPDRQVTWAELAQVVVAAWDLPRSVTGPHFEHVDRRHPAFVALETLYDLGTRADVDLFGFRTLGRERPVPDLLRAADHPPRLPLDPDGVVQSREAAGLLRTVRHLMEPAEEGAVAADGATSGDTADSDTADGDRCLTRGRLAALLVDS